MNAVSRLWEDIENENKVLVGPGAITALAEHGVNWVVMPHPAGSQVLKTISLISPAQLHNHQLAESPRTIDNSFHTSSIFGRSHDHA